jgi:hypothetical protein
LHSAVAQKTRFGKIAENVFPGFPLKAMSHADIICCALTSLLVEI